MSALLAAAAAVVAAVLAGSSGRFKVLLLTVPAVVLASGLAATAQSLSGPPPKAPPVTAAAPAAVTSGQVATSRYIRDHSGADDVVISNRHCTVARTPVCDSRRFSVSAYSERQMLLEGWGYTPTISRLAPEGRTSITHPYWDPARQRLNDRFYISPTTRAAKSLWRKGVRWVYVDRTVNSRNLAPYATLRYTAPDGASSAWKLLRPSH